MAYTTPPTFADGNVLSASQLNILSDDVEFLHGIVSGVNAPFTSDTFTDAGGNHVSRTWTKRREGRYLHYKVRITSNETADFYIYVNGVLGYHDPTNRSATYTWAGYIDLQALASVPAVGAFYEMYVDVQWAVGGTIKVDYFLESDNTTL